MKRALKTEKLVNTRDGKHADGTADRDIFFFLKKNNRN